MGTYVLTFWSDGLWWRLIEDSDCIGHAISVWGDGRWVQQGVIWQTMEPLRTFTWTTDLAGQRFIQVDRALLPLKFRVSSLHILLSSHRDGWLAVRFSSRSLEQKRTYVEKKDNYEEIFNHHQ